MATKKKSTSSNRTDKPKEEVVVTDEIVEVIEDNIVKEEEIKEDVKEEVVQSSKKPDKKESTPLEVDTSDETDIKVVEEIIKKPSGFKGPIYQIRTAWDNISTQKEAYTDINAAIKECNKYPSYKVFDEAGIPIHVSTAPLQLSNNNSVAYAGKKYILDNVKLFASPSINVPKAVISGEYYLYDGKLINNRYRIVNMKNKAQGSIKDVIGYVAIENLI